MKTGLSIILIAVFALVLTGCEDNKASLVDKIDMKKALQCPLQFYVENSKVNDLWGNAQVAISKYSDRKLQIITDYILETYNPTELGEIGFRITREPGADNRSLITIRGLYYGGNIFATRSEKKDAEKAAHLLSYYLQESMSLSENATSLENQKLVWHKIYHHQGNSNETTQPLLVTGKWRIAWEVKDSKTSGIFKLNVRKENGDLLDVAAYSETAKSDQWQSDMPGTYYIEILTDREYVVEVWALKN